MADMAAEIQEARKEFDMFGAYMKKPGDSAGSQQGGLSQRSSTAESVTPIREAEAALNMEVDRDKRQAEPAKETPEDPQPPQKFAKGEAKGSGQTASKRRPRRERAAQRSRASQWPPHRQLQPPPTRRPGTKARAKGSRLGTGKEAIAKASNRAGDAREATNSGQLAGETAVRATGTRARRPKNSASCGKW